MRASRRSSLTISRRVNYFAVYEGLKLQQQHHRVAVQVCLLQWRSTRYGVDSKVKVKTQDPNEKVSKEILKVRKATIKETGRKDQTKEAKAKYPKETRQVHQVHPGLQEAIPLTRAMAKTRAR